MIPRKLIKRFDEARLKWSLAAFFLLLAVPTSMLIWQAYSQLKWESFHQYRTAAEELTTRIDAAAMNSLAAADARSFADYGFLIVTGELDANFVQRSPLSAYPVTEDIPGTIGYFQIDANGVFSTPLLPPQGSAIQKLGVSSEQLAKRTSLARDIQRVLSDNRLVRPKTESVGNEQLAAAPEPAPARVREAEELAEVVITRRSDQRLNSPAIQTPPTDRDGMGLVAASSADIEAEQVDAGKDSGGRSGQMQEYERKLDDQYSQGAFDELSKNVQDAPSTVASTMAGTKLEYSAYAEKKAAAEMDDNAESGADSQRSRQQALVSPQRESRKEKISLPETSDLGESQDFANFADAGNLRISTFESEVDPFEFSMLDSGHIVVFRKVWRDGERFIQGLLIDRDAFLETIVGRNFGSTSLNNMSRLIVSYQNDILYASDGNPASRRYSRGVSDLDSTLLLASSLSQPFGGLQLTFLITQLPAGPGAGILAWVTLILAIVFTGGFFAFYRVGQSQIQLARQQQDFVSAVSHELKTPLTSIRMYGEMLKEGWADEEKKQSYYEFIHDESERLSRLISNVLQLARITRNEPQFDPLNTRVSELMSQVDSKISSQIERAGFQLTLHSEPDAAACSIDVDADCFAQIIINLVDNAIKFSRDADDKSIDIHCRKSADGDIAFSIRDHGPGIPRNQLKKIFTMFYRTESELTRETVGTGIGLAIVHQLAVAMGGTVDVSNQEPGVAFTVTFPAVS
jgi:signal transduction histidine kinase